MIHARTRTANAQILVALCLTLLILVGCGRSVAIEPGTNDPADVRVCQELARNLPDVVGGDRRVSIDQDNGTTAAWGGPPILWRCGVPRPTGLEPTSQLLTVNGVDWLPQQLSAGTRFTTVDRPPYLEVTAPDTYPAPAQLLPEITGIRPG